VGAALADKMTGGKLPEAKAMTGLASALGAIVGCIIGPLVGGAIGRRPTYFLLCLSSLVRADISSARSTRTARRFSWPWAWVGACTASFYGWLPLYLPELFPTRVRATARD